MAQQKIDRFKMEIDSDGSGYQWVSPWPDDNGEWVHWEDVAPYIKESANLQHTTEQGPPCGRCVQPRCMCASCKWGNVDEFKAEG